MRPERWWTVILTMGLFMALSPMSAQAGPNRPSAQQPSRQAFTPAQPRAFAQQPNRQAFTPPQPRAQTNGWNSQPRQWQQPRGNAYGWNDHRGQWDQHRNAYGRNDHQREWERHRNDYGRNDHQREWERHRNAYGQNDHQGQWQQHPGNAYGQNDHQRQWQQPRPSFAQEGDRFGNRQFQPPNGGQPYHPGAGYPAQAQSPNIGPGASGYPHNTPMPAGQTGAQPGFRHPDASGNVPMQGQSPERGI